MTSSPTSAAFIPSITIVEDAEITIPPLLSLSFNLTIPENTIISL